MKILYCTSARLNQPTAPAHHVLNSCKAFSLLGHDVTLVHPFPRIARDAHWRSAAAHEVVLPYPEIRGGWRLYELLVAAWIWLRGRRSGADVFYLRFSPSRVVGAALSTVRGPRVLEQNGAEQFQKRSFRRFAETFDMVLVDTKEMNHLLRDCCEVNVQVHRSPGVDPGVFAPRLKDASRKDLALSCQGCVLLFASGFQRHSDFDTLLKAAGILSQRGFCFTLLLVGAGPRWSEVSRKVRGWGLGDRVVLLGAVPLERLSDCIAASDICLNIVDVVTLREGSFRATKLAEYVCSERPVISTACADAEMPEWALGGLCLVPPASPESLADAIVSVFAALPEWDEHARLARQLIVKDWSWVQVTRSTLAHIDSLIAASRNGHVVAAWPDSSLRE